MSGQLPGIAEGLAQPPETVLEVVDAAGHPLSSIAKNTPFWVRLHNPTKVPVAGTGHASGIAAVGGGTAASDAPAPTTVQLQVGSSHSTITLTSEAGEPMTFVSQPILLGGPAGVPAEGITTEPVTLTFAGGSSPVVITGEAFQTAIQQAWQATSDTVSLYDAYWRQMAIGLRDIVITPSTDPAVKLLKQKSVDAILVLDRARSWLRNPNELTTTQVAMAQVCLDQLRDNLVNFDQRNFEKLLTQQRTEKIRDENSAIYWSGICQLSVGFYQLVFTQIPFLASGYTLITGLSITGDEASRLDAVADLALQAAFAVAAQKFRVMDNVARRAPKSARLQVAKVATGKEPSRGVREGTAVRAESYGMLPEVARQVNFLVEEEELGVIEVRATNTGALADRAAGHPGKPALLKPKTINSTDILLGANPEAEGHAFVGFFEPKLPPRTPGMSDATWAEINARFTERTIEFADCKVKVGHIEHDGLIRIDQGIVVDTGLCGNTGKAITGDYDLWRITNRDGTALSPEKMERVLSKLRKGGFHAEHGCHTDWVIDKAKMSAEDYATAIRVDAGVRAKHGPGKDSLVIFRGYTQRTIAGYHHEGPSQPHFRFGLRHDGLRTVPGRWMPGSTRPWPTPRFIPPWLTFPQGTAPAPVQPGPTTGASGGLHRVGFVPAVRTLKDVKEDLDHANSALEGYTGDLAAQHAELRALQKLKKSGKTSGAYGDDGSQTNDVDHAIELTEAQIKATEAGRKQRKAEFDAYGAEYKALQNPPQVGMGVDGGEYEKREGRFIHYRKLVRGTYLEWLSPVGDESGTAAAIPASQTGAATDPVKRRGAFALGGVAAVLFLGGLGAVANLGPFAAATDSPAVSTAVAPSAGAVVPPRAGAARVATGFLATSTVSGSSQVWSFKPDGSGGKALTTGTANHYSAVASPDGKQVLFTGEDGGTYAIYLMNIDGTNVTRLTNPPTLAVQPSWAPNGLSILWTMAPKILDKYQIYSGKPDGSGATALTQGKDSSNSGGVFSPDGTKILFVNQKVILTTAANGAVTSSGQNQLSVMNADGTGSKPVTSGLLDGAGSWINNETFLFARSSADGKSSVVFKGNLSGSEVQQTPTGMYVTEPVVNPDGKTFGASMLVGTAIKPSVWPIDGNLASVQGKPLSVGGDGFNLSWVSAPGAAAPVNAPVVNVVPGGQGQPAGAPWGPILFGGALLSAAGAVALVAPAVANQRKKKKRDCSIQALALSKAFKAYDSARNHQRSAQEAVAAADKEVEKAYAERQKWQSVVDGLGEPGNTPPMKAGSSFKERQIVRTAEVGTRDEPVEPGTLTAASAKDVKDVDTGGRQMTQGECQRALDAANTARDQTLAAARSATSALDQANAAVQTAAGILQTASAAYSTCMAAPST